MSAISVGRIVTKIMGREAGRRAVVTDIIDRNFVEISGPYDLTGVKRRRVNVSHIEPSEHILDLSRDNNSDEDIMKVVNEDDEIKNVLTTIIS